MKEIAKIVWLKEDLLGALANDGYEPSQENLNKLLSTGLGRNIEERSTETGWEIIFNAIKTTEGLVRSI